MLPKLIALFIGLATCYYLYSDSRRREIVLPLGPVWYALGLFFPFIVLPAYFVFRLVRGFSSGARSTAKQGTLKPSHLCPKCGTEFSYDLDVCPKCGNRLSL